jgi:hypothetical protein
VRDIDGMAGEGVEERGQNHRGLKQKKKYVLLFHF